MAISTVSDFYKEVSMLFDGNSIQPLSDRIPKDIGHFNIFDITDLVKGYKGTSQTPYNRRACYKISMIRGRNRVEYADEVIHIENSALLFGTPACSISLGRQLSSGWSGVQQFLHF
ncbi:MAG: hypothetical protein P4L51_21285 [Puia sp.]|nr:hypothetical protein [Puia sp.]